MTGPGLPGNGVDAFDVSILHALAALINGGQKAEVLLQAGLDVGFVLPRLVRILTGQDGLQAGDFGIPVQHFKPGADFMDAVVDGLQFHCFVDYVFRAGDLAAIVQPGRQVEFVALVFRHSEAGESAFGTLLRLFNQHLRQFGNPLTMAAGVG